MSESLPNNPFGDDELPVGFRVFIAELERRIQSEDEGWSTNDKDVFAAMLHRLKHRQPIDKELQEQYVKAVANQQKVDRYGK